MLQKIVSKIVIPHCTYTKKLEHAISEHFCARIDASETFSAKIYVFNLFTGQWYSWNSKVRVFCYCSSNKINMVQFSESIFPFSQINYQNYFRKLSFCWYFTEYSGKFTFFEYEECHYTDHFKRFHYFWIRYHNLIFLSTCVNVRANSE